MNLSILKRVSYEIERKQEPVIATQDNMIVSYNVAAEKLWEGVLENMNDIIGEDVNEILKKFSLTDDQQNCFFELNY